jgi:TolB-like protein
MDQEYFGDAMAEDLIDQLSKSPALRVSPPRSSFYFKDKRATVGEIAAALNVAYVLDGSLRESDSTLRVTARLVRADGGFIVWSQSYERPLDDLPMIQEDIVNRVVEALPAQQSANSK